MRKIKRLMILGLFAVSSLAQSAQAAGVTPPEAREMILGIALNALWEGGVDRNGDGFEPANEQERVTLPITKATANQVIDVAEISGYAEWCGLDWDSNFLTMTTTARASGFTEIQMGFIGILHGVTQSLMLGAMGSAGESCGDEQRKRAQYLLDHSPSQNVRKDFNVSS